MQRRVVVTGVGLISALGVGTSETWDGLVAGRIGIGKISTFDTTQFTSQIAGEVKDFDPAQFIEKKEIKKMARFMQFALAASEFAMKMAGLKVTPDIAENVGVYIGSGIGGFEVIEREFKKLLAGGPSKVSPFFIPSTIINLGSGYVSIRFGAKGPNSAVATACTTGAHAIGDSYKLIERGAAEAMICGGSEATITPLGVSGFAAMLATMSLETTPAADSPRKISAPFMTSANVRAFVTCAYGSL